MAYAERILNCRDGAISIWESDSKGPPILMIHGTGASKEVFVEQFEAEALAGFHLIAFDLPGHGRSAPASDPASGYTMEGLSSCAFEVMSALGVPHATLLGWSLGGHIAIEMVRRRPEAIDALMLTGTPPAGRGALAMLRAFQLRPEMLFSSKPIFSRSEAERYARVCFGDQASEARVETILHSDGRSRPVLYRSLTSGGLDQRHTVETAQIPIAIVNGAAEPVVRLHYLEGLRYPNLWQGVCHVIDGAGHSPFLQRPARFNALLARFAADVAQLARVEPDQRARSA